MTRLVLPLLLTACAACAGPIESLGDVRLEGLEVKLDDGPGLCPGFASQVDVTAVTRDGQRLRTRDHGGPIEPANYDMDMRGGTVSLRGLVTLAPDPAVTLRNPAVLSVTPIHWPKRKAEVVVPVRYDCEFVAPFGGRDGVPGKPGRRGRDVEVTVSMLAHPVSGQPLVRVVARDKGGVRAGAFLLEPGAGKLTIDASGGTGGAGFDDTPPGRGGAGGAIHVLVDPAAKAYVPQIRFVNGGGEGGVRPDNTRVEAGESGPEPVIEEGEVFEPWP